MNFPYTGGTTNTAAAIRAARNEMFIRSKGDRDNAVNVLIMITDGKSNNMDDTLSEAVATRKAGIHIVTIGVGSSVGEFELNSLASDPDSRNMYRIRDFNALVGILDDVLEGTCNSMYLISIIYSHVQYYDIDPH